MPDPHVHDDCAECLRRDNLNLREQLAAVHEENSQLLERLAAACQCGHSRAEHHAFGNHACCECRCMAYAEPVTIEIVSAPDFCECFHMRENHGDGQAKHEPSTECTVVECSCKMFRSAR